MKSTARTTLKKHASPFKTQTKTQKKRTNHALIMGLSLLLVSLFVLFGSAQLSFAQNRVTPDQMPIASFSQAVEKAAPAVVSIYTSSQYDSRQFRGPSPFPGDRSPFGPFGPFGPRMGPQHGLGSGVIMSKQGYIVTNYHVVQNANEIDVALQDGRKAKAKVVGTDPEVDLAILKIDLKNLPVIKIDQDAFKVGDVVLAIGNPYGVGQTITQGIVSAKGRTGLRITRYDNLIQTDAAINPGNSGGALINSKGELIGINTAIFSRTGGFDGIGFAIPVATVDNVLGQIVKTGHVTRGWLGIGIQPVALERDSKNVHGVLVTSITKQSPAAKAKMHIGDIILKFNGQEVKGAEGLARLVGQTAPGKKAKVSVLRNNKVATLNVAIGARPKAEAVG